MNLDGPSESTRADKDRELFDGMAYRYSAKDLRPAMAAARKQRALSTWSASGRASVSVLVEVGCGAGFGARYLRGRFTTFFGIDYSRGLIEIARKLNGESHVSFEVGDARTFQPPHRPDVILLLGVLHHIEEPHLALNHFYHLLNPGGTLLANEPMAANPFFGLLRAARARMDQDYSSDQEFYNPRHLISLLVDAGFERVNHFGQGLLTTPFAEVALPGQSLLEPAVKGFALVDRILESRAQWLMRRLAWNAIVVAEKPGSRDGPAKGTDL